MKDLKKAAAQGVQVQEQQKQELRRFIPITDSDEQMMQFKCLCESKKITKDDLLLILNTIKINPEFSDTSLR